MKRYIVSDTHFGVRQNSITWLNKQLDFFYKQLIPSIEKEKEEVVLYHCGDVFDSRMSINPWVAEKVRGLFLRLSQVCKKVIVIAGNHDYYSPYENKTNTNSLDLILNNTNCQIVTNDYYLYEDDLFIPWFTYLNKEYMIELVNNINPKHIYVHSSLFEMDEDYKKLFKGRWVFSGHIHTPALQQFGQQWHTLGSCFPLTFADANQKRYYYTFDEKEGFYAHENHHTINFWRIHVGNLNDLEYGMKLPIEKEDYVEIYISRDKLLVDDFVKPIKNLTLKVRNSIIIPQNNTLIEEGEEENFIDYNIEDICRNNIPQELQPMFKKILDRVEIE